MTSKDRRPARVSPKLTGTMLRILQFLAVGIGIFAWWVAMFLLVSLFAVNVWSVTWTQILFRSFLFTLACSIVYLFVMIRRERKKRGGTL